MIGLLRLFLLLNISFIPVQVFAASDLELYVKSNLKSQKKLSGQFLQKRFLKDVQATLSSKGDFELDQHKGLRWQQNEPFSFLMTLDQKELVMKVENDTPKVITAEQDSVVFGFSKVFLALFQGDWALLENYFSIQLEGTKENWKATLTTKVDPLKRAIDSIVVRGSRVVTEMQVNEKKGDRLDIQFQKVH